MKIVALMTSYNESLFFDYAIKSIHDFVDEIVIIDIALRDVVNQGGSKHSSDGTLDLIKSWKEKSSKVHIILPEEVPETFADSCLPGLEMAKKMKGDWLFQVFGDEIWPKTSLLPMRNFLSNCDKNGIMGINVMMHYFAPDCWHCKDFYNPRIAKITEDACMPFTVGDVIAWPKLGLWQSIELDKVPENVRKVNIDYPKFLRAYHYSCVGYSRVKLKHDFYKTYKHNNGTGMYTHYMNKDWDYFRPEYREFTGKHPDIMLDHPLLNERLF